MAINSATPKVGKILDLPNTPTIGTATAGAESATVAYTLDTVGGPAYSVTALSNPGSITGTGTSSPVTVSGLTAGTAYTFTVRSNNPSGSSPYGSASNSVTPTAASSYESISTVNVGAGGASTITFSSIPSTYQHLQVRGIMRKTTSGIGDVYTTFNGDTGANYARHALFTFDGGGPYTTDSTTANNFSIGYAYGDDASVYDGFVFDILDYANTNKNKTARSIAGNDKNTTGTTTVVYNSGLWMSTSAINSITFSISTFAQYTTLALYGIKG